MLPVEPLRRLLNLGGIDVVFRPWNIQFVALSHVAQVRLPQAANVPRRHPFPGERLSALSFQLAVGPFHGGKIQPVQPLDQRGRILVLEVGDQQPQRRGGPRTGRDDGGGHFHLGGQAVGMHRSGPAEGHQSELPGIVSPLNRDQPQGVHHGRIGNLHDAVGGLHHLHSQGIGAFFLDRLSSRLHFQGEPASQKMVRLQAAQNQVGIGHRGLSAPLPVTDGARLGSGASRPHPKDAARVHPGDRPAPGPNLHQVDHRGANGIAGPPLGTGPGLGRGAHLVVLGDLGSPVLDQTHLGGGAPHVEGDEVEKAQLLSQISC